MLGLLPKPAVLLATVTRSTLACVTALSGLFLIALAVRQAAQMIHAALDRYQLPHLLLGLAVVGVKGFFLFRQFTAGLLSASILGSLAPPKSSPSAALAARQSASSASCAARYFLLYRAAL